MLTLKTTDTITGIALLGPISWFEDGSVDCYQQRPMEDVEPESVDDFLNASIGQYEIALDLVDNIQGLSGTPYYYYLEDRVEIHVLRFN